MVVHPAPGHYIGTLVNALLYHCEHDLSRQTVSYVPELFMNNKDTSGVLMVAKNDYSQHLTSIKRTLYY